MVNFAIRVSHPQPIEVLLHGMSLFNIHKLVKELLRWSLPSFLVRRNDQTEALLRGIMTFTGQPLKTAFEVSGRQFLVFLSKFYCFLQYFYFSRTTSTTSSSISSLIAHTWVIQLGSPMMFLLLALELAVKICSSFSTIFHWLEDLWTTVWSFIALIGIVPFSRFHLYRKWIQLFT